MAEPRAELPRQRTLSRSRQGGPDLRAARVVALGLLVSKPTGYLRDALLAARFGTGRAMDAYSLASTTVMAVFDILGTPLQRILVPVLVAARARRGRPGLEATSRAVLGAATVAAAVLSLGILVGAPAAARILAGPGALGAEVADLLRWLSLLPLLLTWAAYATAWLQADKHFLLPAFTGLPLDLGIIGFVLVAGRHGVLAAAWGLTIGTLGQFLLQWPGLRRYGHRLRAEGPLQRDPGLRATARMAPPLLISVLVVQAATLLEQGLAARLAVGTVAALAYARRVLDLPAALFTLPITTVALPRLAVLSAERDPAPARRALQNTAWPLAAGLAPAALLLGLLRQPLAAALYEHGAFGAGSTRAMGLALLGLAPGVFTWGLQQLLRTYFYARQQPRVPMLWDAVALAVNAAVDLGTYRTLHQLGLALGWSIGAGVAWVGMAHAARGDGHAVRWREAAQITGALAVCALITLGTAALLGHPHLRPWLGALVVLAASGSAGLVAYGGSLWALGAGHLLEALAGRLRGEAVGPAALGAREAPPR